MRRILKAVSAASFLLMLVSCKSEANKSGGSTNAAQSTTATQETTAPAAQEDDGQLDYLAEKYISAEERLKRRQDRIKAVLDAAPPAPAQ